MRTPCLLLLALLATPQVASAGLDLTWNACNTSASGADNVTFDCSGVSGSYGRLFANFQTPTTVPSFLAMDAVLDVRTSGTVPPFWHFEDGGCNAAGLSLTDGKPATECPNATNATPWGPNGVDATAAITAIDFGKGGSDRMRFLITVARAATSPFTLVGGQNYFGFEFDIFVDNASTCGGCETPAVIGWSKAILYGSSTTQEVNQSGTRLATVAVNGGIPGPTVLTVRPESGPSTAPASVDLFGRNLVSGTAATLTRTGQADIVGTGTTTSTLGDLLHTTFDIANKPDGFWNANVAGAGASDALVNAFRTTGAFTADSMFPRLGTTTLTVPVTIFGSQFVPTAGVRLKTSNHPDIVGTGTTIAPDGNSLQTTLPLSLADVGLWDVEVTNGDGAKKNVPGGFEVVIPITVTSVSPNVVASGGSALLSIGGTGFKSGASVALTHAGQPDIVGNVQFVNAVSIQALFDLSGNSAGLWDLRITNPGGLPFTAGNALLVTIGPSVASIVPTSGANVAPIGVTITGGNFVSGTTARLTLAGQQAILGTGTVIAAGGNSLTTTFNITGAAAGLWNVEVANPGGITATLPAAFAVRSGPGLTSVSPSAAVDTAVVVVTISGSEIQTGATTKLTHTGESDIVGTSVVVAPGGTSLTATFDIRGRTGGPWNVVVTNPDLTTSTIPGGFSILKIPTVTAINPTFGSDQETISAVISGSRFLPGLALRLERPSVNIPGSVTSVSANGSTINAQFDLRTATAGLYDVVVVNPGAVVGRLPAAFEVRPGPHLTAVSPTMAPDTGVVQLTITATNLLAGATARLTRTGQADIVGTAIVIGGGGVNMTAKFDLTGRALGLWNLVVTNPNSTSTTLPNAFVITGTPTIAAISPTSGNDTQVVFAIITGARFVAGASARLERSATPTITGGFVSVSKGGDSLFTSFDLRTGSGGFHDVVVVNPGGFEARLPEAFNIVGVLRVTAVAPTTGPDTSVVSLVISGANFLPGATARLGRSGQPDIPGTSVVVDPSGTSLSADFDLRFKATGQWFVVVQNPGGNSATLGNAFTIQTIPVVTSMAPTVGTNLDVITATITGNRFTSPLDVRLRRAGVPDVVGFSTVVAGGGTSLTTLFDLRGVSGGPRDLWVTNSGGGVGILPNAFFVGAGPPVLSITPSRGERGSQISATIAGVGFVTGATVMLSRVGLPDIVGTSPVVAPGGASITAQFDLLTAALGDWDVVVQNPDSIPGRLTAGFRVDPGLRLTGISPSKGENGGLQNVFVTGEGLADASLSLRRSGESDIVPLGPYIAPDGTAMSGVFDLTGKTPGLWDVYVTKPSGARSFLTGGFEIVAAPPTFASGIDLTWSACNLGTSSGTGDIAFDCANPAFSATMFGNYRLPRTMSQLVAMDAVIDIQTSSATLPPFWHFELSGCNNGALVLSAGRPATECPSGSNGTAWGAGGSAATSAITAYVPGAGGSNRARLLLTIARASNNPISVAGGANFYGFHVSTYMDNAGSCAGCSDAAEIAWSSATFYSSSPSEAPLIVTNSGVRGKQVSVNGGLAGITVSSAVPAFTPAVGYVPVSIYGRNFAAGASARVFSSIPSFSVFLANVVVAADGRSLTGIADLRGAPAAPFDVEVANPGGATARRIGAINVGTSFPGGPRVIVVAPNGGEVLYIGSFYGFMWQAFDDKAVTSVDLYISQHGVNGPYETLALGVPNNGSFAWSVNSTINDTGFQCFFKVVAHDADGNTGQDVSDAPWRITQTPTAALVSRFDATPFDRGIEVRWQIGQVAQLSRVGLQRSGDAMGPWTTIDDERAVTEETVVVRDLTAEPGQRYFYRLHGTTTRGTEFTYGPIAAMVGGPIDRYELALSSVAPNPTEGPTTVAFTLASETKVRVSVMDVMGREVAVLANSTLPAGRHDARWDGRGRQGAAPTGMYFMQLDAAGRTFVKRFVLAR